MSLRYCLANISICIIPAYFLMGVLLGACSMIIVTPEPALVVPDALEGWKVSAKDHTYNRDTLMIG